jgi:hypothetical protein
MDAPSGRAMEPPEGTAIRVQLDALAASLVPAVARAGVIGDRRVLGLYNALMDARAEAAAIENRKGIRLAKVSRQEGEMTGT